MDIAITSGYVVPVDGDPIDGGTVLISDGKITAVGTASEVTVPDGAEIVDASGQWVLPGFVEAHGHIGVHEASVGWAGDDTNEMTDPNGARMRALDAVNPGDQGVVDALMGGVTSAVSKRGTGDPSGGQPEAIRNVGRSMKARLGKAPAGVTSALGDNPRRAYGNRDTLPSARQGVAAVIRDAFTKAQDYKAKRDHAAAEGTPFTRHNTSEGLVRVLDGAITRSQHAQRADDIHTAIGLADECGYRVGIN